MALQILHKFLFEVYPNYVVIFSLDLHAYSIKAVTHCMNDEITCFLVFLKVNSKNYNVYKSRPKDLQICIYFTSKST